MCSSILWMLALTGPNSTTWSQMRAMKRPSDVPPVVDSSVSMPAWLRIACASAALASAIRRHAGVETELSTTGGTSDGRFISKICDQVVEFGPVNASIHKIDEQIEIASLDVLKDVYRSTLEQLVR